MELVLQSIVTVAHVILAGLFALVPGMLVWLVVLGAFVAFRKLSSSVLCRRQGRLPEAETSTGG